MCVYANVRVRAAVLRRCGVRWKGGVERWTVTDVGGDERRRQQQVAGVISARGSGLVRWCGHVVLVLSIRSPPFSRSMLSLYDRGTYVRLVRASHRVVAAVVFLDGSSSALSSGPSSFLSFLFFYLSVAFSRCPVCVAVIPSIFSPSVHLPFQFVSLLSLSMPRSQCTACWN